MSHHSGDGKRPEVFNKNPGIYIPGIGKTTQVSSFKVGVASQGNDAILAIRPYDMQREMITSLGVDIRIAKSLVKELEKAIRIAEMEYPV